MNKERRQQLASIVIDLRLALSNLEDVRDEEREAYENMPEPLQFFHSEMEDNADEIDAQITALECIITSLELLQ